MAAIPGSVSAPRRRRMAERKPRIIATGGAGQVGTELIRRAAASNVNLTALTRAELDITDATAIRAVLKDAQPDVVINAAAYTAVDKAEEDGDTAFAVNRDAPGHFAEACAQLGIALIHISTDYVFDGGKDGAYLESDQVKPIGVYGASKEAGEQAVRDVLDQHVIMRTSWVYAGHGGNFVRTMLRVGAERDTLKVVCDQTGAPTFAGDIADAALSIARTISAAEGERDNPPAWGTYHYTAKEHTTWHGFAEAIFDAAEPFLGRRPHVEAIPTSEYPTPARRPANSVLDCAKIDAAFAPPRRPWREGLAEVLDELLKRSKGES
jgi:dTDP-4-dehydrorhamnose reductase